MVLEGPSFENNLMKAVADRFGANLSLSLLFSSSSSSSSLFT
jgi:hypothetical protein